MKSSFKKKKKHESWKQEFLDNCLHTNKSEHTLKNYNADIDKFFMWYECHHHQLITKMSPHVMTNYKAFLTTGGELKKNKKRGFLWVTKVFSIFMSKLLRRPAALERVLYLQMPLAVASRKRHLSTIKNFFEFLKQSYEETEKIFLINPVKSKLHNIKLKETDTAHTKIINKDEWKVLDRNTFKTEDRLLLQLMYYAGLRLHEVCQIKQSDFNFEQHSLSLSRKGGKRHLLTPYQRSEIFYLGQLIIQKNPEQKYLFGRKSSYPLIERPASLRSMHNRVKQIFKKNQLSRDLTAHSFRKACATNYYLKTKDLLLVRDYLNHQDAKVTQTYIDQKTLSTYGQAIGHIN